VLSERQLENISRPALHRNMPFTDEYQKRATVFELQGLRPAHTEHRPAWVKERRGGVGLMSVRSRRRVSAASNVYRMNGVLRRWRGPLPGPLADAID